MRPAATCTSAACLRLPAPSTSMAAKACCWATSTPRRKRYRRAETGWCTRVHHPVSARRYLLRRGVEVAQQHAFAAIDVEGAGKRRQAAEVHVAAGLIRHRAQQGRRRIKDQNLRSGHHRAVAVGSPSPLRAGRRGLRSVNRLEVVSPAVTILMPRLAVPDLTPPRLIHAL